MKRAFYFLIIGLLFIAFACNKGELSYSFSRPTHPQNFKTKLGGELYAYTSNDTAVNRADYYMLVEGYVVNYGAEITVYGHCWSINSDPEVHPDFLDSLDYLNKLSFDNFDNMTFFKSPTPGVGDSISFESVLSNLDDDTEYNIRSYVITADKKVWYNPVVKPFSTKPAIDEWFEQCPVCPPDFESKPAADNRFDAIAFNFGDTIFFGTGDKGLGVDMNKDIIMYDPVTDKWDPNYVGSLPKFNNYTLNAEMMDGIGFAIVYQRDGDPPGTLTRSIFVGLGDHGGRDDPSEKANTLWEFELDKKQWRETSSHFPGRSGAVCFVIDGYAYIGTGKSSNATNDWYRFDPVAETDLESDGKITPGWRGLAGTNPPGTVTGELRYGAIAFSMNGLGYFGLGTDGNGKFYSDFYSFKPSSDPTEPENGIWTRLADFPGGGRANAVAFAIGDQGYVGSGDNLIPAGSNTVTFMEYAGEYSGKIFNDFWRYNPYTDTWTKIRDYTADKANRADAIRPITRAVGFSLPSLKIGYVGYGLIPADYENFSGIIIDQPQQTSTSNAQKDFWRYQPFDDSGK